LQCNVYYQTAIKINIIAINNQLMKEWYSMIEQDT